MTIADMFKPELFVKYPSLRWAGTGATYTEWGDGDCKLNAIEASTGAVKTLVENVGNLCNAAWKESADLSLIALEFDKLSRYRHSYTAKYQIYDTKTGTNYPAHASRISLLDFAPSGTGRAMVIDGGVWVCTTETDCRSVTPDAKYDEIQYGQAGWLYEEEVLATDNAMYWAPDGDQLAFLRFNLTQVPYYTIMRTPDKLDTTADSYPESVIYHYPLAGAENPVVTLYVYSWSTNKLREVKIDVLSPEEPWYVYNIQWTSSDSISVQVHNRKQTTRKIILVTVAETITHKVLDEITVPDTQWISAGHWPMYYGRESFLIVDVNADYFQLRRVTGGASKFITSGSYEVASILSFDSKNSYVYYLSTVNSPKQRHIMQLKYTDDSPTPVPLTPLSEVGYFSASFSADSSYFVMRNQGPAVPVTSLMKTADPSKPVKIMEDNQELKDQMKLYSLPSRKFQSFPSADGKTALNGEIWYPETFDSSLQYPVLVHVYGGPGSQEVTEKFRSVTDWKTYLGSAKNYVVVGFDGRGTGHREASFMFQVRHKLGILESEDVVSVVNWLKQQPWVLKDKIAMQGWSYGGYLTLMSISTPPAAKNINAAISVAPVTSWRFYDTAYTERYMGVPEPNSQAYSSTSVEARVDNIKSRFMMVHGTFDDNVHFTNSKALVLDLVEKGIQFDVMYYPNHAHGLSGQATRSHLWTKLTEFLHLHNCVEDCTLN
eukprot:TRINITY_DN62775_c0_g1_i1.p1 TRINITY_DN62775_c0_g1~~TRINITY_DN62775_c0_g1_i1.p1  ORF type:complete len:838 (-),score=74.57 TRINITY_DN62775_c0_g1_i1:697-2844(-)